MRANLGSSEAVSLSVRLTHTKGAVIHRLTDRFPARCDV
jgi:hypothetical protein